jgi:hypothetical protein
MKRSYGWLALATALCGCGGAAHHEAVTLGKVLVDGRPDFTVANATEQDLVTATRSWAELILANGAGQGPRLQQDAAVATDLAKSAALVSTQLGQLRKSVYDLPLQHDFVQGVRSILITEITKRQRMLQDLRTGLTDAAAAFTELSQTRGYKGDSYPAAVDKVNQMVQNYSATPDFVGEALGSLKAEYGIKDLELATHAAAR